MADDAAKEEFLATWMNPSVENLVAEYIECKEQLDLLGLQDEKQNGGRNKDIIEFCKTKVKELETALKPKFFSRRISAAWRLLHRLQEEMILLIPVEQLNAEGENLIRALKLSAIPDQVKNDWVQLLQEKLKAFDANKPDVVAETRQLIRTASNVLNDFTDDQFWDIRTKRWMSFVYLILMIIILIGFSCSNPFNSANITSTILYLGIIGGLASGILSGEQEFFAKGSFWIPTFYYALVRPAFGVLGAFIMFWMLQGQIFIKVDPPLQFVAQGNITVPSDASKTAVKATDTSKGAVKASEKSTESASSGSRTAQNETTSNNGAQVVFTSPNKESSIYIYILLLLIAGFSGDKILKSISDKVMSKLFTQAEKNKDASQS